MMALTIEATDSNEMPSGALRIKKNIWGNYVGYVGHNRWADFGGTWEAQEWVNKHSKTHKVSEKSEIKPQFDN